MAASLVEPKSGAPVVGGAAGGGNGVEKAAASAGGRGGLARVVDPMGGGRVVWAALGGLLATALWIAMFTVGLAVPSQPFRDGLLALAGGDAPPGAFRVETAWDAVYALVIIAFCYTPTNLAMLCCLAALVGCLAYAATNSGGPERERIEETVLVSTDAPSVAHVAKVTEVSKESGPVEKSMIPLRPTISAITWGFFIYLFLISGMMLAVETPFSSTSPDQYLRLAGTASLLAFVVGWRPELLTHLVSQVGRSRITAHSESAKR